MQSDRFRAAAESKDFSAFEEIFAPDVIFRSPAVFRPYEGRDAVAMLLTAVSDVFEEFRYTDQVETGETAMLAFSATVGDRTLDGIDLLRFDERGQDLRDDGVHSPLERPQRSRRGDAAQAAGLGPCESTKPPPEQGFRDGAYRDRTGDLRLAKAALSQLS